MRLVRIHAGVRVQVFTRSGRFDILTSSILSRHAMVWLMNSTAAETAWWLEPCFASCLERNVALSLPLDEPLCLLFYVINIGTSNLLIVLSCTNKQDGFAFLPKRGGEDGRVIFGERTDTLGVWGGLPVRPLCCWCRLSRTDLGVLNAAKDR